MLRYSFTNLLHQQMPIVTLNYSDYVLCNVTNVNSVFSHFHAFMAGLLYIYLFSSQHAKYC